ncbi:MAG: hypothetical protein ACK559_18035, partial [bacterium]
MRAAWRHGGANGGMLAPTALVLCAASCWALDVAAAQRHGTTRAPAPRQQPQQRTCRVPPGGHTRSTPGRHACVLASHIHRVAAGSHHATRSPRPGGRSASAATRRVLTSSGLALSRATRTLGGTDVAQRRCRMSRPSAFAGLPHAASP